MDEKNNPTAKKLESMMEQADVKRKHGVLAALKGWADSDEEQPKPKHHKKETHRPKSTRDLPATKAAVQRVKQLSAAEKARRQAEWEAQIASKLVKARSQFGAEFDKGQKKEDPAHHVVGPIKPKTAKKPAANPVTPAPQAVNMELAQSGNAFSVATLSQLANRQPKVEQTGPDEVTISLH